MSDFFLIHQPVINLIVIFGIMAYSQGLALKAGIFSVATTGIALICAYFSAISTVRYGLHPFLAATLAVVIGAIAGGLISIPLAALRGVYQAIATLAFVQIILSLCMYFDSVTGGVLGFNNIPKFIDTPGLLAVLICVLYFIFVIDRTALGRTFSTIRQDESVAVSLGISVPKYRAISFVLSGALAGLGGCLIAFYGRSLVPEQFGFHLVMTLLAYVVLGGSGSLLGPLIGTALLQLLPEISRPLADNRMLIYGALLIVVITYLPDGAVDSAIAAWRKYRAARAVESRT